MTHTSHSVVVLSLGLVSLTILVLVAGLVLIAIVSFWLIEPKEEDSKPVKKGFHHVIRDVGIAFIVAAVVTIVYGSTLDFHRVSDAISLMIGENVPQSVWDSTRTQVFQRDVFRGDYVAQWTVQPDTSLLPGQALLKVHLEYTLYGLKAQPFDYTVQQELENIHLKTPDEAYPRFDCVTILGNRIISGDELKGMVTNGLLKLPPINLKAWKKTEPQFELNENSGVRIMFDRTEVINLPGTYSVVLSELTKNVTLRIEHPANIQHELKRWFDRNSKGFEPTGTTVYTLNDIVLPGQSISMQFWRTDEATPQPSPKPVKH